MSRIAYSVTFYCIFTRSDSHAFGGVYGRLFEKRMGLLWHGADLQGVRNGNTQAIWLAGLLLIHAFLFTFVPKYVGLVSSTNAFPIMYIKRTLSLQADISQEVESNLYRAIHSSSEHIICRFLRPSTGDIPGRR